MGNEKSLYQRLVNKHIYSGFNSQTIDARVLEDLCEIVESLSEGGINTCEHEYINNGDGVCIKCEEMK